LSKLEPYWKDRTAPSGILNQELQEQNLKQGSNRLQDLWDVFQEVKSIATHESIIRILHELYSESVKPFQTLNFPVGTEQTVHSDAVHFNSEPFGLMCGVWVALEDISEDQGPLIYYPKSHKLPELSCDLLGFEPTSKNYSRIVSYWSDQIVQNSFEQKLGTLKKGQAVIWHANLLHGGSIQIDKSKTRHSQVTHYYFGEAKPWRQLHSGVDKMFFEPNWITF
jgi:ectoine hydroxylase-related dioxygenase (phytanoyl-CoA dioxygenase family)